MALIFNQRYFFIGGRKRMNGGEIRYTIGFDADISAAKASMDSLQKTFSNFGVSSKFGEKINQEFAKFGKAYETYMAKINNGIKTKGDFNTVTKSLNEMKSAMAGVVKEAVKIGNADPLKAFKNDKIMSGLLNQIDEVQKKISNFKFDPKSLSGMADSIKAAISKNNTNIPNLLDQIQASNKAGNYDQTIAGLNKLQNAIQLSKQRYEEFAKTEQNSVKAGIYAAKAQELEKISQQIQNMNPSNLVTLKATLEDLLGQASDRANTLANSWQDFTGKVQQSQGVMAKTADSLQRIHKEEFGMQRQIEMVDRQIQSYFGLSQILRKVMNIARQAMGTVKELDKAMTETAVVTNFDVGDMWEKLPQYTAMANQLGATINDVYKATTLYYQQGLNMNQAMGIAEETLKMARIGGIDAAEATNMMTAALRGFNMQINEMSAQKVNDVYSKIAAMSASNTKELGEAMERTASIANSAGMEFGNTTAFLAQMIETTREAPENLGTAMKTIVARFQEMKKSPTELIDVEGEMVDVNRVDKALKSVGIALTDTEGNFRNLDQVFIEISKRWDSLSMGQQRYIATMAAGSRQQSRFIALVGNHERLMELVDGANNSAGASQEQFNKTLDSFATKANKLKNAWDAFTMGLLNDKLLKGAVDSLTNFMTVVNKIIDVLSSATGPFKGFTKSVLTLVAVMGSLSVARKGISAGVLGMFDWWSGKTTMGQMLNGVKTAAAQGTLSGNTYVQEAAKAVRGNKTLTTAINEQWNQKALDKLRDKKNYQTIAADKNGHVATVGQQMAAMIAGDLSTNTENMASITGGMMQSLFNNESFAAIGSQDGIKLINDYATAFKNAVDAKTSEEKAAAGEKLTKARQDIVNGMINSKKPTTEAAANKAIEDALANKAQVPTAQLDSFVNGVSKATNGISQLGMLLQNTPLAPFGKLLTTAGMAASAFAGIMTGLVGTLANVAASSLLASGALVTETGAIVTDAMWAEMDAAAKWKLIAANHALGASILHLIATMLPFAAVAATVWLLYKAFTYNAKQLQILHDRAAAASDAYKAVKQEVSELKDNLEQLEEYDEAFKTLVSGTAEFNSKLVESNELITQLIKKYPMLETEGYVTTDKNGRMQISQAGRDAIQQLATERQARAQAVDIFANADYKKEQARQDVYKTKEYENAYHEENKGVAGRFWKLYKKANQERIESEGLDTTDDVITKAEEKANAQVKQAQAAAVTAMITSQKDLIDKNAVSQVMSEGYEQLLDAIKADTEGKDRAKAYAEAYGYEYISGNKFKDQSGNEIEIDKSTWNDELTNKRLKANEQIISSAETVDRTLDSLNGKVAGAFDNIKIESDTLISDILSSNIETNRDDLKAIIEEGNLKELTKDLTDEQIEALKQAGIDNLEATLKERGEAILEAQKQQDESLATMLAKARGINPDDFVNNTEKYANQISAIGMQLDALSTKERNLLATVGQGIEDSLGQGNMSKFVSTFIDGTQTVRKRLSSITRDVDWTSSISALGAITKMTKSSVPEIKKLGQEMRTSAEGSHLLADSMQELFAAEDFTKVTENMDNFVNSSGRLDATGIQKMAQESGTLSQLLKTDAISAGGLAAALNATSIEGVADVTSLNDSVLQLLSTFTQLNTAMAEAHDIVSNFDPGIDTGEGEDFIKNAYEKAHEYIINGEWGNEQLENYMRLIVGDKTWTNALAKNNGDLEKTVKHLEPVLNNFKDGFLESWRDLGNGIDSYGNKIGKIKFNNEHQDKLKVTRENGRIFLNAKESGATTEETLKWIEKSYKVSSETSKLMLSYFKNYSPDLVRELEVNDFNAGINNGDFYNANTIKTAGGNEIVALSTSTLDTISAATGKPLKELNMMMKNSDEYRERDIRMLTNTYTKGEKKGQLIDDYNLLNKRLSNIAEGQKQNADRKNQLSWLKQFTEENTVNVDKALQFGNRFLDASQTQGMLYEAFKKMTQGENGKEFKYNGEVIDPSEITSLGDFIDRLTKIDENENWNEVGQAIAAGYVAYMRDKDKPPKSEPKSGSEPEKPKERKEGHETVYTGKAQTTVPISGGSIKLNKNGAIIEPAPKPNKTPQISEVPVQGRTIKVDRTPNNLYSRAWHGEGPLGGLGTVASWFKKIIGFATEDTSGGVYADTNGLHKYTIPINGHSASMDIYSHLVDPTSTEPKEKPQITPPKTYKQTNDDSIKLDNSIKKLGKTTQTTSDQITSTTSKYNNLNKSEKAASDSLQSTVDATKTSSDAMVKNLGQIGRKGNKKLQEELNKLKNVNVPAASGKTEKKQVGITAKTTVEDSSLNKLQKKLKQADAKIKIKTDDKELKDTTKDVQTLQKTGKKGIIVKTKVKNNSITKAENAIKSVGNAAANVKDANVNVKSTADLSGVNKIVKAAKVTQKMPVTSVEAPGARNAINSLHSLASKDESFSVNVKSGNKKSFKVVVEAAAKGKNNHFSTERFFGLGSLAAGTQKGRLGPKGKGGLTLTGEEGYEVAWLPNQGKSMILGANGPEMLNLPGDAVVWNHEQSKKIVKRKQFSGGSAAIGAGSAASIPDGGDGDDGDDGDGKGGNKNSDKKKKKGKKYEEILTKNRYKQYQVAWEILKKAGKISTWWENISKQVAAAEKLASRNQKVFERTLTKVGATLSDAQKAAQNYAKYLGLQVKYNTKIFKTYNNKLNAIDKGKVKKNGKYVNQGITTSGGKKLTGTAAGDYIVKQANKTGKTIKKGKNKGKRKGGVLGELNRLQTQLAAAEETDSKKDDKIIKQRIRKLKKSNRYKKWLKKVQKNEGLQTVGWDENERITYKYTDKKGRKRTKTKTKKVKRKEAVNLSKYIYRDEETGEYLIDYKKINKRKNASKAERKAIKEAAQKKVDEINKRRNDALEKTINSVEAIQKIGQDIYDNFYGWKNELTEIWNITRKITELESDSSKFTGMYELYQADLAAGLKEATLDFIKEGVDFFNADVMAKTLAIDEYMKSIPQLQQDLLYAKDRPDLQQLVKDLTEQFNNTKAGKYINQRDKYDPNNPKQIAKWEAAAAKAEKQKDYKEAERLKGEINAAKEVLKIAQLSSEYFTITQRGDNSFTVDFDSQKFEDARLSNKGGIGAETYNKMKDYIDNIIDINNQLNEQMTTAVQKITELRNDLQEIREQYADYADDLLSAYEDHKKAEVDRLENIYNCLNDHIKNLLDKVKKNLDKRRQQEDNNKTEEDINDKQQRLARLRASTSSGNRAEILKLEKEIADAQNSYGRTLEDQLLSSLEEQADEASKQRERQIKLLNAQLQLDHLTGKNAAHIDQLLADIQSDNKVTRQAALKEITDLHKEQSDYYTHPIARKVILDSELQTQINELTNYEKRKLYIEAAINATDGYIAQLKASFDALAKEIREKFIEEHGEPEPVETPKLPLDFNAYQTLLGGQGSKQILEKAIPTLEGVLNEYRDTLSDEELAKWEDLLDKLKKKLDWFNNPANFTNGGTSLSNLIADGASAANKPSEPPKTEKAENLSNGGAKNTPLKTYQDYVAKVNKGSDITAAQFRTARTYATDAKVSMTDMGKALVKGSGNPTWKQLMKAAKAAGVTQKQAKTWWGGVSDTAAAAIDDWKKYAKGGFADFTGPAWLDGTRAKPEAVLSATDTKNFVQLRDILSDVMGHISNSETSYGNVTYDIDVNVERLASDYDVDKVAKRIEKIITKDASYRNVTQVRKFR